MGHPGKSPESFRNDRRSIMKAFQLSGEQIHGGDFIVHTRNSQCLWADSARGAMIMPVFSASRSAIATRWVSFIMKHSCIRESFRQAFLDKHHGNIYWR